MGSFTDLASYSVWAQLPESQRGLDAPQQGNHIQVLDAAPWAGGGGWEVPLIGVTPSSPFSSLSLLLPTNTPEPVREKSIGGKWGGCGGRHRTGTVGTLGHLLTG